MRTQRIYFYCIVLHFVVITCEFCHTFCLLLASKTNTHDTCIKLDDIALLFHLVNITLVPSSTMASKLLPKPSLAYLYSILIAFSIHVQVAFFPQCYETIGCHIFALFFTQVIFAVDILCRGTHLQYVAAMQEQELLSMRARDHLSKYNNNNLILNLTCICCILCSVSFGTLWTHTVVVRSFKLALN